MENQGGNWKRTAPSFPARCSGASAPVKRSQISSTARSSRWRRYTRVLPGGTIFSGSALGSVGCWVRRENALTSKVKPSGVRSTQRRAVSREGRK
jgi:hypothetical protein